MIKITKIEPEIDGGVRIYPVRKSTGEYLGADALGYINVKAAQSYMKTPKYNDMCLEVRGQVISWEELKDRYNGDFEQVNKFIREVCLDWMKNCVEYLEKKVTIKLNNI